MEAIFFRYLARELSQALAGARVEKIYLPAPNYLTLALHTPQPVETGSTRTKNPFLHVRYGTGRFFCFLSALKTTQPPRAPAEAMRLRKHLRGRRLECVIACWPRRQLMLCPADGGPALYLDPRSFPMLGDPPAETPEEPGWPDLDSVLAESEIWQAYPQFSPMLRRRLTTIPRDEAQAVLARLVAGEANAFFVEFHRGEPESVWPICWPERVRQGREVRQFSTALAAATAFGEPLAFGEVSGRHDAPQVAAKAAGKRRLVRALAKLEADEARMHAFLANRGTADLLAAQLHRLDGRAKLAEVVLTREDGTSVPVPLDPSLTVVQNMQKLYRLAAKGQRGLGVIAARKQDLQDGKKSLQDRKRLSHTVSSDRSPRATAADPAAHVYRTSDGFLALRGRNAKANEQLLRQANAYDLWFHVADGPGAHVILRRDHPGREVPRRSIEEAAGLAALASYAGKAASADVWVALVADVRRTKGAATGRVAVTNMLETVRAAVTPDLERLREPS